MTNDSPTSQLKEAGNQAFAEGDWDKALSFYTQALNLIELDTPEKAILYKNKAAVYLKVSDYEAAIKDCTTSLEICPNDPKALFRRCQAYEALEKFEEAYKDARQVHNLDKNNKAIAPVLKRLHDIVQDRVYFFKILVYFWLNLIAQQILEHRLSSRWLGLLKLLQKLPKWWKSHSTCPRRSKSGKRRLPIF